MSSQSTKTLSPSKQLSQYLTSHRCSMDQRVIRSLKAYQKSLFPQKAFQAINKTKSLPAKTLDLSQQKVQTCAIANYLAKGKILKEQQKSAIVDYDDSFGELHYEIVTLAAPIPYIPPLDHLLLVQQLKISSQPIKLQQDHFLTTQHYFEAPANGPRSNLL